MKHKCSLLTYCTALIGLLSTFLPAGESRQTTKPQQPLSFSPQTVRVWDKHNHEYVWRTRCGNNSEDHQMAGGFEWVEDNRDFISLGEAWVRGKRRGGLLMLSFPDGNVLNAEWDVNLPKGQSFGLQ